MSNTSQVVPAMLEQVRPKLEPWLVAMESALMKKINKAAEKRGERPYVLLMDIPSQPKTKKRNCLNCGRVFQSIGPINRLCVRCGGSSAVPT